MRKIGVMFFAIAAILANGLAFAAAVVTSVTGTAQAVSGTSAARTLRPGDQVVQGDAVSTGAASSVVLRFEDGHVAALSANSRLLVSTYNYNTVAPERSNVLLSLVSGGMRAITGLIGRRTPQQVAYRAANATIGIRGTDVTLVTDGGNVVVSVTAGQISFAFGGQTINVPAGQGVNATKDGKFQQVAAEAIAGQLQATPEGRALLESINGLAGLNAAIEDAARAATSSGEGTPTALTPYPGTSASGSGGGSASQK